jgi:hypothetical protein
MPGSPFGLAAMPGSGAGAGFGAGRSSAAGGEDRGFSAGGNGSLGRGRLGSGPKSTWACADAPTAKNDSSKLAAIFAKVLMPSTVAEGEIRVKARFVKLL